MATKTKARQSTWRDWFGADVIDRDGEKIGTLENVYMDRGSGRPEWFAVKTGLFGMKETFVPIEGMKADGDRLRVACTKEMAKDAPKVDEHDGFLPEAEEQRLYQHYGRKDYRAWDDDEVDLTDRSVAQGRDSASRGRSDDAMTRSEEELEVDKRRKEAGRVRLHKWVETENVDITVPLRKEKARVVREPVTGENRDEALRGPDISESDHEITLTEEEAVVSKKAKPKERVRLEKDVVEEQETVSGDVRKERIEVEGDEDPGRRTR